MAMHFFTTSPALTRSRMLLAAAALTLLSACQSAPRATTAPAAAPLATSVPAATASAQDPQPAAPLEEAPSVPILGKHADAHGCKPSTGHAWCERTQRCERPWELALQRGFENTQDGWRAYCEGSTR